jgi:ATP-dependent RNA helicase RhlE
LIASPFTNLGVTAPLARALASENHSVPTPIQLEAIPLILAGRDLLGVAQTGTGKTAAFVVPILQALALRPEPAKAKMTRALILAPTRELALQIGERIAAYGRYTGLRHTVVLGGVGQTPQVKTLARGIDILVATPGRLLDLVGQGHVLLAGVGFFVLDEADRMLDMGFIRVVRKIVALLPKKRQSLLFSATMPAEIAALAGDMLTAPVRIDVSPAAPTVERIDQRVFFIDAPAKRTLLESLLIDPALARVLVFTRTKNGANRVAAQLARSGVAAEAIHGNKSQGARQRALDGFRSGRARVLVATDIAARGIDVDGITHVINYDLPNIAESYIHRIGRTARAGASGIAYSFCDPSERPHLRQIEALTKRRLHVAGESSAERPADERPSASVRSGTERGRGGRRSPSRFAA